MVGSAHPTTLIYKSSVRSIGYTSVAEHRDVRERPLGILAV